MAKEVNLGSLRTVDPVTLQELEQMHTGTLLKRLENLRALHPDPILCDWSEAELAVTAHLIAFKNTDIWKSAWDDIKLVLAGREHVKRGSKALRQQAAKMKQNRWWWSTKKSWVGRAVR